MINSMIVTWHWCNSLFWESNYNSESCNNIRRAYWFRGYKLCCSRTFFKVLKLNSVSDSFIGYLQLTANRRLHQCTSAPQCDSGMWHADLYCKCFKLEKLLNRTIFSPTKFTLSFPDILCYNILLISVSILNGVIIRDSYQSNISQN